MKAAFITGPRTYLETKKICAGVFAATLRVTSNIEDLSSDFRSIENLVISYDPSPGSNPIDWLCNHLRFPDLDYSKFEQIEIHGQSSNPSLLVELARFGFTDLQSTNFGCVANRRLDSAG